MIKSIKRLIAIALAEDIGAGDITTNFLVPAQHRSHAYIIAKEDAVICGIDIAKLVFHQFDKSVLFNSLCRDGDHVKNGARLAQLSGKTRSLLTGERVALNFLGYLSGIATNTHNYVEKIRPFKTKILDTRKTTPRFRFLEKYAVRCGGGTNHRFNLNEMALVKDNHREVCHPEISIQESVRMIRRRTKKLIEVEVDDLRQFEEALLARPDMILLDNMRARDIRRAVRIVRGIPKKQRPLLEASGGINLKTVKAFAATGVDRISIGSLTHTMKNVDISMEIFSK